MMDDLDQFEACRELAQKTSHLDIESRALAIQQFINYVEQGETYRMAVSLSKNPWNSNIDRLLQEKQGDE